MKLKKEIPLGISVFKPIGFGFCSQCYGKYDEGELSEFLEESAYPEYLICIEQDGQDADGNIIYSGCGQLISSFHGKCGLADCCETCGEVNSKFDSTIDDTQMIQDIRTTAFGIGELQRKKK